jgi:hypothetical protein
MSDQHPQSHPFHGWAIDRDHLEPAGSSYCRIGYGQTADHVGGFHTVSIATDLRAADVVDPVRFRTLDDDGNPYHGGVVSRDWLEGADECRAFGPLAFSQADAGATELQYRNAAGEWETL